jgi:hypothetical protein
MIDVSGFDYEEDLSIDPDALDMEWTAQPTMYMRYAELLSRLKKQYEESKLSHDYLCADLDSSIRANPIPYTGSMKKPSEAHMLNIMLQQPSVKVSSTQLLELKHLIDIFTHAVKAMDLRKSALENLVRLHGQQYFAGPAEPRDNKTSFEQYKQYKQVRKEQRIKDKMLIASQKERVMG